ncbi:zinc ribbon domain-containing protein [Salirhabdus salicampi]|uniref:zinc ribbon domain-containing protein n=1 Tax=Salirhabdus salicampi TaxID=476102 RepID=UPI0020C3525C|nr:zinc ribbon domain-containing protein [Salirhabdus salicampi]MCP8616016.1 zinc ribbon domain-containing protein [Salirhabdus salicampi]
MAHCPYCSTEVNNDEQYCIKCGRELPTDLEERLRQKREERASTSFFHKWWLLPIGALFLAVLLFTGTYFYLDAQTSKAKELYENGALLAVEGHYSDAKELFEQAMEVKGNFSEAQDTAKFMDIAINIQQQLTSAKKLMDEGAYQQAVDITKQAENKLKHYNGQVVSLLLEDILATRNEVKTAEVEKQLVDKPTIEDLKLLLWQVESIQSEKAQELASEIRKRLVDHTYSSANELLKVKQFNTALGVVKDGLKYAPDNEKLTSMKTTIEKEKVAFETEQRKRIEQAMNAAEQEYERNKNDAIEIISIETQLEEYGGLVVRGIIESVATVPIYSVSVSYKLLNEDKEVMEENEVYLYPETLYPNEIGQFEINHFDIEEELTAEIETVKWFLDSQ